MESRNPQSLNPSPARTASSSRPPSPFRHVQFDEKAAEVTLLADIGEQRQQQRRSPSPLRPSPFNRDTHPSPYHPGAHRSLPLPHAHSSRSSQYPSTPTSVSGLPSPFIRAPTLGPHQFYRPTQTYTRPRGLRIANLIKPWIPLIMYGMTSLAFLVAIAFWKEEVFARLDELAVWLRLDEQFGYAVMFLLIFLTTFPPIPLYSTLIILSGYTFGPWTGAIISYFAALTGALTVFIISRTLLRETISRWLSCTITIKRVVRAIEKRPKLLFLIRLAPYPYNVMNCLLAASPTLTLQTYTVCTALSLFKVIIHTGVGASIHSFKDYHAAEGEGGADMVARAWTVVGVVMCVAIFVYLSYVARKAVDEELDDDAPPHDSEEARAFLSGDPDDLESGQAMAESPFRRADLVPRSLS
ncbi:hypothetical protein PLICRDRAFT_34203 [Plicaturopsis crispa FD-325 SS-3]|nr:hypothetical protein PLICRDRAFT_34203 [Plicaturopsis crispa FD-325 SS-3]